MNIQVSPIRKVEHVTLRHALVSGLQWVYCARLIFVFIFRHNLLLHRLLYQGNLIDSEVFPFPSSSIPKFRAFKRPIFSVSVFTSSKVPMLLVLRVLSSLILKDGVTGHKQVKSHSLYGRTIKAPTQPVNNIETVVGNCNPDFPGEGVCQFVRGFVDIYYWSEPDADTSCFEIVSKATTPLLQDATIEAIRSGENTSMKKYWGCAAQRSSLKDSYITTAAMSTICNFSFKVS